MQDPSIRFTVIIDLDQLAILPVRRLTIFRFLRARLIHDPQLRFHPEDRSLRIALLHMLDQADGVPTFTRRMILPEKLTRLLEDRERLTPIRTQGRLAGPRPIRPLGDPEPVGHRMQIHACLHFINGYFHNIFASLEPIVLDFFSGVVIQLHRREKFRPAFFQADPRSDPTGLVTDG